MGIVQRFTMKMYFDNSQNRIVNAIKTGVFYTTLRNIAPKTGAFKTIFQHFYTPKTGDYSIYLPVSTVFRNAVKKRIEIRNEV